MNGCCHTRQCCHRLALAAGRDDDLLLRRETLDAVDVHDRPLRELHIAELRGDLHDVLHRAARHGDLASAGGGRVDDLLDAVDVRGERRDDDALIAPGELPRERLADGLLAHGIAGALHVRRIGQQRQHALLAQLAEAGEVDDLPVDGSGVDLEVAGVDNGAHPRVDGEGHGVGDGVVDVDELHLELARLHGLAGLDGHKLRRVEQVVLLQLEPDEPRREAGAVDGHVHLLEDVGDGPDVVLVAVGDEQTADAVLVLGEVAHVGNDKVDAVHIVAGKGHAAVHDDDLAAVLIHGHVLADLVQPAERDDLQIFCQNAFTPYESSKIG